LTTEVIDRRWSTLDHQGSLAAAVSDSVNENSQFFESGVWELLNARTCLCGSYAYGFYLSEETVVGKNPDRMFGFEMFQNELEEISEHLSQMMARPYLRIPRRVIIQTIQLCKTKRQVCYFFFLFLQKIVFFGKILTNLEINLKK